MLDTNFLFLPFVYNFDLIKELNFSFPGKKDIVILKDSINELEKLKNKKIKYAKIVIENILKQKIRIDSININEKDIDTKILKYAKKHNAFIATNDKKFKEIAKKNMLNVIIFNKSKKKIMVE